MTIASDLKAPLVCALLLLVPAVAAGEASHTWTIPAASVPVVIDGASVATPGTPPIATTTPQFESMALAVPPVASPERCSSPQRELCIGAFGTPGQQVGSTPTITGQPIYVPGLQRLTIEQQPRFLARLGWSEIQVFAEPHAGESRKHGPFETSLPLFGGIPVTACGTGCDLPRQAEAGFETGLFFRLLRDSDDQFWSGTVPVGVHVREVYPGIPQPVGPGIPDICGESPKDCTRELAFLQ